MKITLWNFNCRLTWRKGKNFQNFFCDDVIISKWRAIFKKNNFSIFGALYSLRTWFFCKSLEILSKENSIYFQNLKTELKNLAYIKSYSHFKNSHIFAILSKISYKKLLTSSKYEWCETFFDTSTNFTW